MIVHSLFLVLLSVTASFASDGVVHIANGPISGQDNEYFYAFRGIPYAEAPVGDLRFAPPVPFSAKWTETREFENWGKGCAQYNHFGYKFAGDEDCLSVNVFVPKAVLGSQETVPVIVFIHGGAFIFGGAHIFFPDFLMKEQDIILVTIQYRLGVLGFLSTEDSVIPGNYGLKDQVEALRWVQRNIAAFNGDPKKVTLAGWSAGGASVHLHYMSPQSDDLFNNGISHSGNALDPWVMVENSRDKAHQVAAFVNCPQNHTEMLKCLRSKPAEELVMLAKKFQPFLYNPYSPFGVVVEPESDSAFLTDHPLKILKSGNFKKLPWLLSQTQDEGLYPAEEFYDANILKSINDEWDHLAPHLFDFNGTTNDEALKIDISRKIRTHYIGNASITLVHFAAVRDIFTDRLFKHQAFKALELQSKHSPTYFYHFLFKTAIKFRKSEDLGVDHGEDIFMIYKSHKRVLPFNESEQKVSRRMVDLYFTFANSSIVTFGDVLVEKVNPEHVEGLEIENSGEGVIRLYEKSFGNGPFWDGVEKSLQGHVHFRFGK